MKEIQNTQNNKLKRKLKNRHIQFIALGSAVGTGLFLGASSTIFSTGPSVLLGYLVAGLLVFFIMRQLGEMVTNEPMAGSSSYFANVYVSNFLGFLAGWNYWVEYVLVGMAELIAVAAYMQYWFPNLATWQTSLFFFLLINAINLATVKAYGEIEFWFSSIKIIAICAMILTGSYILFFNPSLVPGASIKNLWQVSTVGIHAFDTAFSGFFSKGFLGFMMAFPMIIFAFDGVELIGLTAAETEKPQTTIPKAVNQVVFRILIFYIGSLTILLSLYHWSSLQTTDSPFVMIFDKIGFKYIAWTLNFIVLTAALSVYNSCIYCNSRMLYGLALQNNAPKVLAKTNKRAIPSNTILISGALTFLVIPLNYFLPNWINAFEIVISFSVICIIINWSIIAISHLMYRKKKTTDNIQTLFPAPFYPYSNYTVLFFLFTVLITMTTPQFGMVKQAIFLPIWIFTVYIGYKILKK
ncbi:MAG: amino acid permease [Endomicrobium sp.]|jgi:L-asparagine transporter-like permease|nr:amino acid permease [Endomicrobium sp.]